MTRVRSAPSSASSGRVEGNVQGAKATNFMTKGLDWSWHKIATWSFVLNTDNIGVQLFWNPCGEFPLIRRRASFLTQTYLMLWRDDVMYCDATRFCFMFMWCDQVLSEAADSASLQLGGWLSWQSISWLLSNLATLILFTLSIDLNYVIVSNYSYLQGFQNSFYQSFGHSSSDHPGQSSKMVRRHEGIM